MVTDFVLELATNFVTWVLGLFPADFAMPTWFTGFSLSVSEVLAGAAGMGVWIPWSFIFVVVTATFALWAAGLLVKFARWVIGLIPTMGGG